MDVWQLGSIWEDERALARAWRDALPFPHLVIDGLLPEAGLAELLALLEEEAVEHYQADIYAFDATAPEPKTAAFRALRDTFAGALAGPLSRIASRKVTHVDMRAYAYRPGHFLLPHTDHQTGVGRALAYAYYLPTPEPPLGGELELFRCTLEDGELTSMVSTRCIEPVANRLVVFDVSEASLHQVREVLDGLRPSLSGWFYP